MSHDATAYAGYAGLNISIIIYHNIYYKLSLVFLQPHWLNRDKFDYTHWRENLWQNETLESLSDMAQAYYQSRTSNINRNERR
jgi:hypothetical protein